ncbi:universal stress protein [Vicingaceae bacterium]|nr:universal stress protein [Vicingaceae bacterium]MDB4060650.1 universal stress protein [Vicingaceae bacterium]
MNNTKHQSQLNKILIPIDFPNTSKLALEYAANLCKAFDSELHLVHIYKTSTIDVLPNLTASSASLPNYEGLREMVIEELNAVGEKFSKQNNIAYNIEVKEGSVSKGIIASAKDCGADLIVIGTHGVSGFEEFFMGSNAYRVVTSSAVPLLTVQEHSDKMGFQNIVLPIDCSQHTRDKVSEVVALAELMGSKVHIAQLMREDDDTAIMNLKVKQIEEHLDHKSIAHQTTVISNENIAEATLEFANKVVPDLIATMTDQENYTGFFIGEYSQQIVNHSKIPVLSVTPIGIVKGFSQDQLGGASNPF